MIELSNVISSFKPAFSRIIRGLLLIIWILGLSIVAIGSLNETLVDRLLNEQFSEIGFKRIPEGVELAASVAGTAGSIIAGSPPRNTDKIRRCPNGQQLLLEFRFFYRENSPPIDALLDVISPNWATPQGPAVGCTQEDAEKIAQAYKVLFIKVAGRIESIARNESLDPKTIVIDTTILPFDFQPKTYIMKEGGKEEQVIIKDFKLPIELQDWITQERVKLKSKKQARSLASTFILLSALGAFGSLIFLIRDYMILDEEKKLSDYIFRPVLGIFLAVAIFILDILAHSVISTASILEIRYEPLYILALSAGLLSERVYEAIRHRADTAISQYDRNGTERKDGAKN